MEVLPANEFVSGKEGVFHIPDTVYHNHILAPEVNRGLVMEMMRSSAAHVLSLIDGKLPPKKPTPEMVVGSLFDRALLEPDLFNEGVSHWVRPPGMRLTTTSGIAWKKVHSGLPILTSEQSLDIRNMIEAVMRHKLARRIVEESSKQESAFCLHPDTHILRKCRPDARLVENSGRMLLADLKSTFRGGASADAWSNHCARMGYHIQDAFYSDIYRDLAGEDPFFVFLVVERKPPYAVRLFEIHEEGRNVARDKYRRALDLFKECKASGVWPSYPETIERIRLPRWELHPPQTTED